jgi:hypothetical protein
MQVMAINHLSKVRCKELQLIKGKDVRVYDWTFNTSKSRTISFIALYPFVLMLHGFLEVWRNQLVHTVTSQLIIDAKNNMIAPRQNAQTCRSLHQFY